MPATSVRRFLNQLGERETLNDIFLLGDKQLRKNRNGNLYLQMKLSDKTATVNGMMWNASDQAGASVQNGDYVQIEGTTQFFNGALQIIVNKIEAAEPGSIHEDDFIRISQDNIAELNVRLAGLLRGMENTDLRNLAECFLTDDHFMAKLSRAPAAVKNHHAFHGGLLEHLVGLMQLCQMVAKHYPNVDNDLLLMGAFLHDIGKIHELSYDRDLSYSDEGQLLGHLVMGVEILNEKLHQLEKFSDDPFPTELSMQLKHMILSHHGRYEYGSPKLPMTLEAMALHQLDDLDAKLNNFQQTIDEDVNTESPWTTFQPQLGRKIYKGPTT